MTLSRSLGLQLYSARMAPPLEDQLKTVRQHGFTTVEPFGALYDDVPRLKLLLEQNGLSAASGHFDLAMAERQPDRVLEIARTLGLGIVVVPYLPPEARPTDREGWVALGRRLDAMRRRFAPEGLRVAWHNHDFEFVPLPDGSLPLDHLLGDALLWEADLAWTIRGGADPGFWIERYRGRIPLVHVKDLAAPGDKADEGGWADVGAGVLPWADLWRRCVAAGAEVMIAEHDNPSDFGRFVAASAAAMGRFDRETGR